MLYALGKETSFPPFADDRDLHISVLPQAAAALFWRRLAFVAPVLRVAAPRHGLGANLPRIASGRIPRRLRRRMLTSASPTSRSPLHENGSPSLLGIPRPLGRRSFIMPPMPS